MSFLAETTAMQFAWAYERCMSPQQERTSPAGDFPIPTPAIICAAFSAELGLKSILYRLGKEPRGHDLRALYDQLPDEAKSFISTKVKAHFPDFETQLDNCKNAFVEWRYVFQQKNPIQLNSNFIHLLACHVIEYVASKHWTT